jgi:hydroxymethylpyrimidine pyrophosphatase-like HAD family hydrolase
MKNAIYFDMDGTIANLYGVENWLEYLIANDPTPYAIAKPLVNMNRLARLLNRLQAEGYHIGIVSWLSKDSTEAYDNAVTLAKVRWLDRHLHSVNWNEIKIVPYGTPKQNVVEMVGGILFDDESKNRENWTGVAYDVENILEILKGLL